ncbi:MAG TPA: hypothetical protein VIC57_07065 [Candidatus Dormibacteraeota bacterium]|jgi:hypothetical protein
MIDYELVRLDLEERRELARRMAAARRAAVAARPSRPASVRRALGLSVVRLGLRVAGEGGR